jgi:hypothetical protein
MVLQVTQVPSSSGLVCGVKLNYGTMQCPVAFRPVRYGYGLVHWNGNDQPGEQEDTVPMRGSGVWAGWLDQPPADDCCTAHVRLPLLPAILLYPESTWTCSRGNVRRSSSNGFVFCWVPTVLKLERLLRCM